MNANRFRLVFSKRLGMLVPAHEDARGPGKGGSGRKRRRWPAPVALPLVLAVPWVAGVQAQLPVPCAGGACGVNPNPTAFVSHGAATYSVNRSQGVVTQTTPRAILNWQSYNIGAGHGLTYGFRDAGGNLPAGASFATLNRIWQGSPSEIAGRLQVQPGQNGQIYLINQNGILFKDGAQVNVGGLVASTLDITDTLFLNGIQSNLQADTLPAFLGEGGGVVRVEAGAELRTEQGGRVMLLAKDVENHGLIQTPEGQTILAAGAKVYLAVSDDPRLRGFLVEVDGGGTAANTGRVIAERGNVSMTGLTVNQSGRVTATTSVNLNGSIRLMARDAVASYKDPQLADARALPLGTQTGTLVLGAGSVTEVLPETASGATLLDEQTFNRSLIQGVGRTVHVQSGAQVRAQGGEIDLAAQAGQLFQNPGEARVADARLQVDAGALVDVSGLRDVAIPVERNFIQVELRGDELKDAPLQRDSFLRGSTVWIDIERGTPLADVSGYIAKVGRTVAEKSTPGGDLTLRSEGDLVLNAGALLDVSGGSIAYQAGFGRTTQLILNGGVVDIGSARPDVVYDGFADQYVVTDPKWGATRSWDLGRRVFIPGYVVGRDAGRLSVSAHRLLLDAELRGQRVVGERQRARAPQGGLLRVVALAASGTPASQLQDFRFASTGTAHSLAMDEPLPDELARTLRLSAEALRAGGFGRLQITSEGRIDLPAGVVLDAGPGGSVSLSGRGMGIGGAISAPGGSITLTTREGRGELSPVADTYALTLHASALLDVAGRWVNDLPTSGPQADLGAYALDGGSIRLSSHADLDLAPGSLLDASAGARLGGDGRLTHGRPGSIGLASGRFGQLSVTDPLTTALRLGGELRAHGFGPGGRLSITASSLHLGQGATGAAGQLVLDEGFFARGGFQSFELTGIHGVRVAEGFQLEPRPRARQLTAGHRLRASGEDLAQFTVLTELPNPLRPATRVTLKADEDLFRGDVRVDAGARIRVSPQGEITLIAKNQLTLLGSLEAPAGRITLRQTTLLDGEENIDNFDPGRSVFLGTGSRLLATGYSLALPDAQGLRKGRVLDGGEVVIEAGKGYLIQQADSLIDVSGTAATLDLPGISGLRPVAVASNGGGITLTAREGMLLEGGLRARAGGDQAQGGRLSLTLRRDKDWKSVFPLPDALQRQRRIVLQAAPTDLSAGLAPGMALDTGIHNGMAVLALSRVEAGGFADLTLEAQHRLGFKGDLGLDLPGRLALTAPNLESLGGGLVRLNAAALQLGPTRADAQGETLRSDASGGPGRLALGADLIELVGHASLQGFDRVELASRGDLRLRGVAYNASLSTALEDTEYVYRGGLATGGDLTLKARQVYPVSMAEFSLEVHNNPTGRIVIESTASHTPVLSAGGRLRIAAPRIEQGGVLKAPFGEIELHAETISRVTNTFGANGLPTGQNSVTLTRVAAVDGEVALLPGSLTSVSAEGQVIPLGRTELSGRDWVYDFGPYKRVIATPPQRRILLDAGRVEIAPGARLDLSGGGDLLAYEFLPGPGGSRDFLQPEHSAGLYAIVPGAALGFAPHDAQTLLGMEGWQTGAAVRLLEDAGGLRAGTYALLPARYALLPGVWLVRVAGTDTDRVARGGASLPTGYTRVAGHVGRVTAGGGVVHGARTATLEVAPGGLARTYSEYLENRASGYYAGLAGAQQVADAGRLTIAVAAHLSLAGELTATWGVGARGPELDIAASRLAVTPDGRAHAPGYVSLDARQLADFGTASLLLGGVRGQAGSGGRLILEQRSDEVVIGEGVRLAASELILAAREKVAVVNGAELAASGASPTGSRDLYVVDVSGDGAGALLRLAAGAQVGLTRAPVGVSRGVLEVAAGAVLRTEGAAILDATLDNLTQGEVILPESGGALTVGAGRIRLTENGLTDVPADGLVFDQDRLATLGHPARLYLRSYTTLDLHGDIDLGGSDLDALIIEAAGLAGHAGAGRSARLTARRVELANPDHIDPAAAFVGTPGQGDLDIRAQTLALGPGVFTLSGFGQARLVATAELLGRGGELRLASGPDAAGDLRIEAGRITVAAGVDQVIRADGALTIAGVTAAQPWTQAPLGGRLELAGKTITHGGRIELPAGDVLLRGEAGLTLAAGSEILAGGVAVPFADIEAHAPAGQVLLEAVAGDVRLQTGARIDVAGAATGGHAGELTIRAQGDAVLDGTLTGGAATGYDSGRFRLSAARLNPDAGGENDYAGLNARLEAGGFRQSRRIRLGQGDLVVAADVTSRAREIELAADGGSLRVAGTLDASGPKGGRIELHAGKDLELQADARLLAAANEAIDAAWGTAGRGGTVVLGSGEAGRLRLSKDSLIDVSVPEGSAAAGGRLVLRALRSGSDVALDGLEGRVLGAARVELEAYRVYAGVTELISGASSGTRLGLNTVHADNSAFAAAADLATLRGGLEIGSAAFVLRPGVEVRAAGDLTLSQDWNLNPLRYGGEGGVLTLRAAGNLRLNANLSDGFSTATTAGLLQSAARGWDYRLTAGADLTAADPRVTHGGGDVRVAAGKLVRTGPGRLEITAGQDVVLEQDAALYSAGYATPNLAGFTLTGITGWAFPTGGGDVSLRAGGAVVATHGPGGLVTDWLWRQGNLNVPNSTLLRTPGWWPQIAQFRNGVAALGGGDVQIEAGGRVANLVAATVTNARQPAAFGQPVDPSGQVIQGGGDLSVRAGGAIEGGLFLGDRGAARISTRASLAPGVARGGQSTASVLALGDARGEVSARQALELEAVVTPGMIPQVSGNLAGTGGQNRESYMVTYAAGSAAQLISVAGDLTLINDRDRLRAIYGLTDGKLAGLSLYPGMLEAAALAGDLNVRQGFTLLPSAQGDLRLLAAGHLRKEGGGGPIHLSDAALSRIPTLTSPRRDIDVVNRLVTLPERESDAHGPELLHAGAAHPAYIVAGAGDLVGQPSPNVFAVLAKPAVFQAGRDIVDVTVVGQNLRPDQVTRFLAGRDIRFGIVRDPILGRLSQISAARIAIGGPGRLELLAGRDIDLGAALGVLTRGNLANPWLPEGGADLLVVAGARALGPDGAALPLDGRLLDPAALAAFFADLAKAADEGAASGDYGRGAAAIADLFPVGSAAAPLTYRGDINLFFSQFKTEQGGDIQLLAPGGLVNAGLASLSEFQRAAADLGIMTVQGGAILAYTRGDFQVNSSRVFTISGGDILLWSAEGNIDAGKGAKTASATPPPRLRIDKDGNFVLDVSQSIAGSGIGALRAGSNVALVAPKGEVNAGDAGIRAGGNLTIVAERVVGADNIQVGGVSTGVPVADTSSLGASLGGLNNLGEATKATQEATQSVASTAKKDEQTAEQTRQALASFRPSFISVEVLGFGETGSLQDEAERRRRQEEERLRGGGA